MPSSNKFSFPQSLHRHKSSFALTYCIRYLLACLLTYLLACLRTYLLTDWLTELVLVRRRHLHLCSPRQIVEELRRARRGAASQQAPPVQRDIRQACPLVVRVVLCDVQVVVRVALCDVRRLSLH